MDEVKYWGTEFAQKRYWSLIACDPSRERLEQLRDDVFAFADQDPELQLVEEVRRFLPHYAPTRDREELRRALADPARILRDRALFEALPPYLQAMFRNELHPFRVEPAEGGGWELMIKVHLLPGVAFHEVRDELLPEWLFHGLRTVLYVEPAADHGSPIDHPVLREIEATLRSRHPGATAGPLFLPWTATDSRFFRAYGAPSYGFSPFTILTTDVLKVGAVTERIALPGYVEGVEIYRELLRRLVT
jgi:hypothetical protein